MADTSTDWQREVIDLKAQGLSAAEIADAVGKHAATVRKVIARANEAVAAVDAVTGDGTATVVIPGQVDIDGNEARDPLEQFKAEAGEAVGDMQERPGEEPAGVLDEPVHYEVVQGTRQMAIDFGPEADVPTGGTLVVKSEKLASGFFGLGDVITGTFTARIVSVGGKERFNEASEQFRAEPQAHVALITEVSIGAVGGGA